MITIMCSACPGSPASRRAGASPARGSHYDMFIDSYIDICMYSCVYIYVYIFHCLFATRVSASATAVYSVRWAGRRLFIHSRLHSRAMRVSDGSTMHRLTGIAYGKGVKCPKDGTN